MENLRLKYGDVELPIQTGYTITKSSQEVDYSDIICGWDESYELPERYQEVQIVNIDTGVVKAYGYIDTYDFGEMRETDDERDITISLFTPMKLTTLRTAVANGVYSIKDLIQNYILTPLLNDGFTVERLDIADRQITVNFNIETVEFCLNNLSNKFNFWWFIDEYKKIYIIDFSVLTNSLPTHIYDNENMIDGLQYIRPTINSDDYANVINFKNVRTYQESIYDESGYNVIFPLISNLTINLKKGEELTFNYPADINPKNIIKSVKDRAYDRGIAIVEPQEYETSNTLYNGINMIIANNNTEDIVYYKVRPNGEISKSDNISIDTENRDTKYILITDTFFTNLVTGIRYNGDSTMTKVRLIQSDSILIWNNNKYMNDADINKKKGKISKSGIVEKTIDMNSSWKTNKELTEIATSYFKKSSAGFYDKIELVTDKNTIKIRRCNCN